MNGQPLTLVEILRRWDNGTPTLVFSDLSPHAVSLALLEARADLLPGEVETVMAAGGSAAEQLLDVLGGGAIRFAWVWSLGCPEDWRDREVALFQELHGTVPEVRELMSDHCFLDCPQCGHEGPHLAVIREGSTPTVIECEVCGSMTAL